MSIEQIYDQGLLISALIAIALGIALHLVWITFRDTRDRNRQPR